MGARMAQIPKLIVDGCHAASIRRMASCLDCIADQGGGAVDLVAAQQDDAELLA
jgi:hypothetical protein